MTTSSQLGSVGDRTATQASTSPATSMVGLLDRLQRVAESAGRSDLSTRLSLARLRVTDPALRIVVTGQSGNGITSTVNALVGRHASTDNPGTPVVVSYGAAESARQVREPGGRVARTEVGLPDALLAEGVVLVDMPGVSAIDPRRAGAMLSTVPSADAVLFVSDASQEFTEPEITLLQQIHQLCPTVICVVTKIDLYPRWADIQKANRGHLTRAGLSVPLLPVSAELRLHALRTGDRDTDVESGCPQLLEYLRANVVAQADKIAHTALLNDIRVVSDHLALALNAELDALSDPVRGAELVEQLRTARDAADTLRKRSADWQHTLNDGAVELITDIEHDLRHRLREVMREAETDIMASDPAPRWAEFAAWLDERTATTVRENFVMAHTRSTSLADRVAEVFANQGSKIGLPAFRIDNADTVLQPVTTLDSLENGKRATLARLIASMRGSYGGVLMVGLVTSLMGLALVNPFSIGAGVLLGAYTFREDRKTLRARRQTEAKVAVGKLMDDVIFQVNKESKARLRTVQRALRDHFTEVAGELLRSVNDSLQAAQQANSLRERQRTTRTEAIAQALSELRQIRVHAAGTAATGGA